ncbi:short chain dehydrogenase [Parathielavia appendiculata]|uniref:Short chain dehydrogenase n=1 Tax=Parathielavia appendiculata TaxID=2587402 RepID=A0AAN6TQR8_9PEZI|nr:short chain dehydrogenase [Parathielavia appendiculata]
MGDLSGKTYFITGGSGGLGKGLAKILFARGAHVTLFARNGERLASAKEDVLKLRVNKNQELDAVSVDLADGSQAWAQVEQVFRCQKRIPDDLYCSTGGAILENGFLADITPGDLKQAINNNYLTAVFAAQAALRIWREADRQAWQRGAEPASDPRFTLKVASKYAVRAIADTLRLEALLLSNPASTYKIHCAFPGTFISPALIAEQASKPRLTKQMEGTDMEIEALTKCFPSSDEMAQRILAGVERGSFAVCPDFQSGLLRSGILGPSARRGPGIVDTLLGLLLVLLWPLVNRFWFERMCKTGRLELLERHGVQVEKKHQE